MNKVRVEKEVCLGWGDVWVKGRMKKVLDEE